MDANKPRFFYVCELFNVLHVFFYKAANKLKLRDKQSHTTFNILPLKCSCR